MSSAGKDAIVDRCMSVMEDDEILLGYIVRFYEDEGNIKLFNEWHSQFAITPKDMVAGWSDWQLSLVSELGLLFESVKTGKLYDEFTKWLELEVTADLAGEREYRVDTKQDR